MLMSRFFLPHKAVLDVSFSLWYFAESHHAEMSDKQIDLQVLCSTVCAPKQAETCLPQDWRIATLVFHNRDFRSHPCGLPEKESKVMFSTKLWSLTKHTEVICYDRTGHSNHLHFDFSLSRPPCAFTSSQFSPSFHQSLLLWPVK